MAVACTLAASWLFAAISTAGRIDYLFFSENRANLPFLIKYSDHISRMNSSWEKSGAAVGDRVLAVEGQPFAGYSQEFTQVRQMHRGDLYHVQLQKPSGQVVTVTWPLPSRLPFTIARLARWNLLDIFLEILFPVACLLLATWVLLSRPRDWSAWYVFSILSIPLMFFGMPENFSGFPLIFMGITQDWEQMLFAGAVFCFGLDFPARFAWERRQGWLRWILLGPLLLCLPVDALELLLRNYAPSWFRPWEATWFRAQDQIENVLLILCISIFCATLCSKFAVAQAADAKRRLRVLVIGSQLGLWPVFLLVVRSQMKHVELYQAAPPWIFITVLLLFLLFPLSLAYAILVERAMDVRILLRQGTQYALARGTLIGVRIGVGAFLGLTLARVFAHRGRPASAIWQVCIALALLFLLRSVLEKRARLWIDRKFFRESYAAEQVLSDLVAQAGAFTEAEPLLNTVSRRIADTLHVENVVMLMRSGNGFRLQTAMGVEVPANFLLGDQAQSVHALEKRRGPATVYFDRPDDWLMDASDAERSALRELNAEVLLPLPGRHRLMGVMALGPKRSEQPYSKADLQLLTSVGTQTGLALENSELLANLTTEVAQRERMNRELEIAHEVQERLFPQSFPELPGVQVTGSCRPAQGVGGDYYDCMITGGGRLALAVGDVSGKGVSAALLMASLRASLRGQTMLGHSNLAQIVTNVNALLFDSSASNRYATFFFGEYDPATRKICYVNAGHNPPAVIRKDSAGAFERHWLNGGGGPVVGLIEAAQYEQCELQMQSGDLLLLYTDGISEAMNPLDEEWGEERMVAEAERLWPRTAQEILNGLVNAADRFAAGAEQHDDMTLMVMKLDQ